MGQLDRRRTKIVATIGPATNSPAAIEALLKAGADVFRLNLSHGSTGDHSSAIASIREASKKLDKPAAILMDLQGPKIRAGRIAGGAMELRAGERVFVDASAEEGGGKVISTTYKDLHRDLKPGDRVLLDDGLLELKVFGVNGASVECEVVYGGVLKGFKGMNLPGVEVSAPCLTEKDVSDIEFGISKGVDYIALSFVRKVSDILALKDILKKRDADIQVIAKIEKAEAVDNLASILDASDGIMIARGDLGVELSAAEVPVLQKMIISKANETGRLVITATQMLESMISNPRPTRAEASDVANAVFDGTDALMLSGETAVGKYPVQAVETMVRIALAAEEAALSGKQMLRRKKTAGTFAEAVAFAAKAAADEVGSKAVVVFTQTGDTARLISKLRPAMPLIAFTPLERTWRRLALVWGVHPFAIEFGSHTDEMICRGEAALLDRGIAEIGDTIVIVSGTKVGMRGATNMMKIDWIGSDECKVYLKGRQE